MALQPIVIEPAGGVPADSVVIWLHGLGADGEDFAAIVPRLPLGERCPIRFVLPTAPERPITLNGGVLMRGWYDIRSWNLLEEVDAAGIRVSCYQVFDLIQQQIEAGIAPERIVLAGFSQGGVLALHAALSYEYRLAGVIALSTYFPMPQQFFQHRGLPVFYGHGTQDEICPLEVAETARQALEKKGYDVEWHTYPMAHSVCEQELQDIAQWLQRVLCADKERAWGM